MQVLVLINCNRDSSEFDETFLRAHALSFSMFEERVASGTGKYSRCKCHRLTPTVPGRLALSICISDQKSLQIEIVASDSSSLTGGTGPGAGARICSNGKKLTNASKNAKEKNIGIVSQGG